MILTIMRMVFNHLCLHWACMKHASTLVRGIDEISNCMYVTISQQTSESDVIVKSYI